MITIAAAEIESLKRQATVRVTAFASGAAVIADLHTILPATAPAHKSRFKHEEGSPLPLPLPHVRLPTLGPQEPDVGAAEREPDGQGGDGQVDGTAQEGHGRALRQGPPPPLFLLPLTLRAHLSIFADVSAAGGGDEGGRGRGGDQGGAAQGRGARARDRQDGHRQLRARAAAVRPPYSTH